MTRYQTGFGYRPTSDWGQGDLLAPWAEGDIVDIPAECPAFALNERGRARIPHTYSDEPDLSKPGRYRVLSAFSIGEGDEWYFRVCPMVGRKTLWDESSDRIHMIPGHCNYAEGWTLIKSADPEHVRSWPHESSIAALVGVHG